MQTCLLLALMLAGGHGGGVTKTDEDGISKYWSESIKALEHKYGKTSDKDLYGATLPPSVIYNVAATKINGGALDKRERFVTSNEPKTSPTYSHNYDVFHKPVRKTEKPTNNINYSDFKPISQTDYPQTFNYLKHIDQLKNQKNEFRTEDFVSFQPYLNYVGSNPEESDAFRTTKDFFVIPKGTKVRESESAEIEEDKRVSATNKAKSKVRQLKGNGLTTRLKCRAGICRKKSTNSYRSRPRPPLKKIKRIVYNF